MDRQDGQSRQTAKLSTESWVEVSSQPSSSSLSSIGDEIVTTGLRVGNAYSRRRRPTSLSARCLVQPHAVGSSQDEYDESESEEDGVLSSSGENLEQHQPRRPDNGSDESDDDGDDATALGRTADCPVFRPQPNAFSHPPTRGSHQSRSAGNVMPPHPHSGFTRPPFPQRSHARTRRRHARYQGPKKTKPRHDAQRMPASVQVTNPCNSVKSKRDVAGGRSPRATKKKRIASATSDDSLVSPTLLTWVVSAGVVVLVSVVGFGAGYVIGREVGHQEALSASVSGVKETTRCGREVIGSSGGGLRRLRWGAVGRGLVAQVS
ncbi:hypothetical protein CDD81_2178 [Ophiocordyceps australis]|uniref:Uncharacterized protein n=1 Tax=Ophiocordyceps australis TaxID=1399860 RepID=A0A2C5X7Q4_9HYPO|nr:hypothetical protein CDD81_2178 [Ophiocordyceps australis]